MKVTESQAGWGFWLGWVVASTVGVVVGSIMGIISLFLTGEEFGEWLAFLGWGIMLGVGVGILQWLVLRRRVSGVGWWVLATAAGGYGIFQASFILIEESLSFGLLLSSTGVAALGGAVTGILQWLVLRGKVSRAGWWVLASTVGWGLSMAVSIAVPSGVTDDIDFMGLVVTGAVLGAVTGAALVWLLRQPVPEAQLEG
jgi:hypothetical protein